MAKLLGLKYDPIFEVPENIATNLGGKKIGEKVTAMLNYKVIEKTKNYTVLQVDYLHFTETRRVY